MKYLPIEVVNSTYKNQVFCADANELIKNISGDILYLDPPYTPTQYNSQYHVLETIVRNDNPLTHGVGAHRINDRLSNWSKKGLVEVEFERLIHYANFKHIIFSYSAKGIMSQKFIENVLKRYGKPETYHFKKINFAKYKSTRAVTREKYNGTENEIHYEYLFYIEKSDSPKFNSPLNYIGGKFKSLDLIMKNLPNNIDTFYDLFGGGSTVGINIKSNRVVYNDINYHVSNLLKYLSTNDPYSTYKDVKRLIKKYGLEKANKDAYLNLRRDYNANRNDTFLYLLVCYGFEHQIRFNSKHEFNNPCGNSGFNEDLYEKLISYCIRAKEIEIDFHSSSFIDFKDEIKLNDFVYLDPPYLSNRGVYQDGKRGFNGWDDIQENIMYSFLDDLNSKGVKFMLSNFTEHDLMGENSMLINWVKKNNYTIIVNEKITKRNRQDRRELIVINYGIEDEG